MRQALTKRSDTSGISSPRHDSLTWVREHSAHELRANLDPSIDHTGYWWKCQSKGGDVSHVATAAPLPKSKSLPSPIANLRMMHARRTQILYFQPGPPYTQERTPFRLCKAAWLDSFPFRVSPIR